MTVAAALVRVRELRVVRGGRTVVEVPSLDVARGETWVLVGPNGSGKTSLLKALGLLARPDSGSSRSSRVRGQPSLPLRRRVLTTFQETMLLDETVLDNVALPSKLRGAGRPAAAGGARGARALRRRAPRHRRARRLSGGEARRVALARGLPRGRSCCCSTSPSPRWIRPRARRCRWS